METQSTTAGKADKNDPQSVKNLKTQLDINQNNVQAEKVTKNQLNLRSKFAKLLGLKSKSYLVESLNKAVLNCQEASIITAEEKKMIQNIIEIGDTRANDVAIPRTDISAVKKNITLEEIKELIKSKAHTRIPVYEDNLDQIIGFIHSKDLLKFEQDKNLAIESLIRKIIYVPNSMRIIDLLLKMRASRIHIAIVLDEYGGTDGLVTIEDIMEEIVGDIEDEYDLPDNNIYLRTKKVNDFIFHVGGRVEIEKVEELISEVIVEDKNNIDFETISGLILEILGKVPEIGESISFSPTLNFKILDADMRSIKLVEITKNNLEENQDSDQ